MLDLLACEPRAVNPHECYSITTGRRFEDDRVGQYAHLVADECHHLPPQSFEQVVRRAKAKYVTGLSATVARKDGHHPIVFMQCGPVRYRVDAKQQALARPFVHTVCVRPTGFRPTRPADEDIRVQFQDLRTELIADEDRNRMICQDLIESVREGRSPIVLTERTEHLERLAEMLAPDVPDPIILRGGMGRKQTAAAMARMASTSSSTSVKARRARIGHLSDQRRVGDGASDGGKEIVDRRGARAESARRGAARAAPAPNFDVRLSIFDWVVAPAMAPIEVSAVGGPENILEKARILRVCSAGNQAGVDSSPPGPVRFGQGHRIGDAQGQRGEGGQGVAGRAVLRVVPAGSAPPVRAGVGRRHRGRFGLKAAAAAGVTPRVLRGRMLVPMQRPGQVDRLCGEDGSQGDCDGTPRHAIFHLRTRSRGAPGGGKKDARRPSLPTDPASAEGGYRLLADPTGVLFLLLFPTDPASVEGGYRLLADPTGVLFLLLFPADPASVVQTALDYRLRAQGPCIVRAHW